MNDIPEKNMETVLREIKELRGLDGLSNGRVLVSLFSDLSTDKKDLRLIRYLVESGCHTDLLGARELSPAMQQARLQQTVNKLCTETLISEETARQVCTAFWDVIYSPIQRQERENNTIPELPPKQPEPIADRIPLTPPKPANTPRIDTSGLKYIIALLVLAAVLAVVLFPELLWEETPVTPPSVQVQEEAPKETLEKISLAEAIQRAESKRESKGDSRVLKEDPMQYNRDENGRLTTFPVFGTDLMRDQVASVTFLSTLKDAPEEVVDLSAASDGSVQAWIIPNGNLYDLYIAAEGGVKAPKNSRGLFALYTNVKSISFNECFDTSEALSMDELFYGCNSLKELDLSGIDTSNVTSMTFLFNNCASLETLDLSDFNTSNIQSFAFMFSGCSSLTSLNLKGVDTKSAESLSGMFSDCGSLKTLNISHFDTSLIKDMSFLFDGCSGLTTLDLTALDTSKVEDMQYMFSRCENLTKLDLKTFQTAKVTKMNGMFYNCKKLSALNLTNFDTSQVRDMRFMFSGCDSLRNIDLSNFNVANVTENSYFMASDKLVNGRPWKEFFMS